MENIKRIGIDCRMINESGIGRYIYNLVKNLTEIDSQNHYLLFVFDKSSFNLDLPKNFELVSVPVKWHGFAEQTKFLKILNSQNLDLFHSPHPNMPYFYSGKFIITIHDLTMLNERTGRASTYIYPIYFIKWLVFKVMLARAIRNSSKVITVSNFVKNEIIRTFKTNEKKIEVIYNGVPERIKHVSEKESGPTLEKFSISRPYLFYVGNAYPHKNLEALIEAFKSFNLNSKYTLVLGGREDYFFKRLKQEYKNQNDIKFLGELTDEEISSLYSSSQAFVYPSISEGFGIQIVEAIKCHTRIICSDNTSFPEIAGDYAFYFNPFEKEKISKALSDYVEADFKEKLPLALESLKKFDWKISAQKHYEIIQKI